MTENSPGLKRLEYSVLRDLMAIDGSLCSRDSCRILLNLQVSGGQDSMCLLHVFARIARSRLFQPKHHFTFVVQHFNHKKRGRESEDDALFVVKASLAAGFRVFQSNLPEEKLRQKGNFQALARQWRKQEALRLCRSLADHLGCHKFLIVTAHHARDHVESVLLHLLRGCSLAGLVGIQKFDEQNLYYRPFHAIEYDDLCRFGERERIAFREDSSNHLGQFDRNYLRKNVLPHFAVLRPHYQRLFFRLSKNVLEEKKNYVQLEWQNADDIFFVTRLTTAAELYHFFVRREKKLASRIKRGTVEQVLHEAFLLLSHEAKGELTKTLPLSRGWKTVLSRRLPGQVACSVSFLGGAEKESQMLG